MTETFEATQAPVARVGCSPSSGQDLARGTFVPLPGGFRLWSQGALRSAGFPVSGLLELGDAGYAAAVDRWNDAPDEGTRQALADAAARGVARQARLLAQIAGRADFQEAVSWQNPGVVEPMIIGLAQRAPDAPNNQKLRKRQRIVVKYWSRYCAKNESIGFFGPVSWFSLRGEGEPLRMKPGPALVSGGEVCLEPWAIDAVAASLASDPQIRPWIAPRKHPTVFVSGTTARTLGGPVPLEPADARLLALVDGVRAARDIAAELGSDPAVTYQALDDLAAKGLICWDLEPPLVPHADRVLRRRLEAITDPAIRQRATGVLARLEAARDTLAGYRSAAELRALNTDLETEFTQQTGVDPQRRSGQTYGGRRLTYLECVRDVQLSFGPQLMQACAEPFSLLLTSARWFAHEAAERLRSVLSTAFDAMNTESAGFNELVFSCADKVFIPGNRPLDHLITEFGARWRGILGLDTGAHVVTHTSEALRGPVQQAFGAGRPSWGFAWQHSIDLLVAARGEKAFQRGEFQPVIGEVHVTYCPFETPIFGGQHPDQGELRGMLASFIPDGRVMLSPVKDYPRVTARTYPLLNDDRDWRLCVSAFPARGAGRQLPLCGLEVSRVDGKLAVGLPGAAEKFDVVDICGAWMMYEMLDVLKHVVRGRAHSPRVLIDKLVVFRETWSFPISELGWINERNDAGHLVAARRWLRATGLPDLAFVSISSEPKPVFVDFRSEVGVANLAQLLRAGGEAAGATVAFCEMLPAPDETWLADAGGHTYTSELRLQFVDGYPRG